MVPGMSYCLCVCDEIVVFLNVGVACECFSFFFQAEDGIRDLVRSRGLGDVYKRQDWATGIARSTTGAWDPHVEIAASPVEAVTRLCAARDLSLIHI